MTAPYLQLFVILLVLTSCGQQGKTFDEIDLQGHRGARGLWPENSIEGFVNVLDHGVNTLEMDLVITRDSLVLVSHEPFFSEEICLDQNDEEISPKGQRNHNIFQKTYDEILSYDCGSKKHPRFPEQTKLKITKPLLVDVINAVKREPLSDSVRYNIEIKTNVKTDDIFHPTPSVFSDLVYQVIDENLDWSLVTIQSFDFRVLQYFQKTYPKVQLALLIENKLEWTANIDSLGFTPEIYSCDYMLLSESIIKELQVAGMAVIPWTVNERDDMDQLLKWNVDGIITDYPNRTK